MSAKVYLETFGCQMNVADAERAATHLRQAGYAIVDSVEAADAIIFNTCSVRERAEQKLYSRIGEVRKLKAQAPQDSPLLVGVMGCVAQLEGASVFDHAPAVRMVVGTRATDRLPQMLDEALRHPRRQVLDLGERDEDSVDWNVSAAERHSPHTAFVPIIEGCNKFCSFCIVPYSRGRERSRPAQSIINEISRLRAEGFREVHLIGQNVNSYRPRHDALLENFSGATAFSRLLRAVAATGMERIKFTTSFPRDFHPDIVAALEEHENLCNWIHLPVQSGNDRVLKAMRRGYRVADYLGRIAMIKKSHRRFALTSDIIVGFPGETDAEFMDTVDLVRECEFDGLYIFKYSARRGTPAAGLPEKISSEQVSARFQFLNDEQMKIQNRIYQSYVGRELEVLVEGMSAKSLEDVTGHTGCHKVVNFAGKPQLIGQTKRVRIVAAKAHSLRGELADQEPKACAA